MHALATTSTTLALCAGAAIACPPEDCNEPYQLTPQDIAGAQVQIAPIAGIEPAMIEPAPGQPIDLVICLDTSGSMDGLIESAKQKLWAIVNDLALAEPAPELRVALITFGNNGHDEASGWTFVQTGLTEDLDTVSEKLFVLKTNGGTEYVGRALHTATGLDWHPSDSALKLVVVAGNESADQDKEKDYREVCKALIERDILVNAIYCGDKNDNIAPGWQDVARRADGQFANIDQDGGTVVIETPFDEQLSVLSVSLNDTYIPFGEQGQWGCTNQTAQDANAAGMNRAAEASRAATKASKLYSCSWDLVDALAKEQVKLADVKAEDLPEEMREMSLEERQAHVDKKAAERAAISRKIADATVKRQAYITEEMRKLGLDEDAAFDAAIRRAIRDQARAKGIRFTDDDQAEPGAGVVPASNVVGPEAPEDGC